MAPAELESTHGNRLHPTHENSLCPRYPCQAKTSTSIRGWRRCGYDKRPPGILWPEADGCRIEDGLALLGCVRYPTRGNEVGQKARATVPVRRGGY